jgi:hypothetical protein
VTRTTRLIAVPRPCGLLACAATLDAGLLEELAVLLLGHPLATLLDYRTHEDDLPGETRRPGAGVLTELDFDDEGLSLTGALGGTKTRSREATGGGAPPVWKKLLRRYSFTASPGTRNDRPTRTAGRSPE